MGDLVTESFFQPTAYVFPSRSIAYLVGCKLALNYIVERRLADSPRAIE